VLYNNELTGLGSDSAEPSDGKLLTLVRSVFVDHSNSKNNTLKHSIQCTTLAYSTGSTSDTTKITGFKTK